MSSNISCSTDINQEKQRRKQLVLEGVDLILSLFIVVGQQRLFPRTIMTKNSNGQIVVHTKEQMLYWFEQADYQDCRINAYPAFLSKAEERDYDKGVSLNLFSPNILFIDLDAKRFDSNTSLQRALKQILKNIASLLYDVKPLVLWSGHGYHIIIPVNAKEALENFTDFMEYTTEPSKEFLQFAERFLSLNKADMANNPGFKSCLLRVPYTFNSECLDEGIDAEVKIFQQWDSSKPLPDIDNLLVEFQTFLVDKKLKAELEENKRKKFNISCAATKILPYAERLLHMSIPDYRKFAVSLILAPYFINIQHLSDTEAFCRIKEWLLKCSEVRNLEPSVAYFDDYTRKAIERARSSGIKSLKFQETLKVKNKALYEMLRNT
ncbi:MAG: DNA primase noncatalytic subunit PriX [Candidatus Nitrosopolaris sp.]